MNLLRTGKQNKNRKCSGNALTHCGLVTPCGDRDLGQHYLRWLLVAWRHQAITWTIVDWSSVKSSDIQIRAISQVMSQPSITKICLKITCLKYHANFPEANELREVRYFVCMLLHRELSSASSTTHIDHPRRHHYVRTGIVVAASHASKGKLMTTSLVTLPRCPDIFYTDIRHSYMY